MRAGLDSWFMCPLEPGRRLQSGEKRQNVVLEEGRVVDPGTPAHQTKSPVTPVGHKCGPDCRRVVGATLPGPLGAWSRGQERDLEGPTSQVHSERMVGTRIDSASPFLWRGT